MSEFMPVDISNLLYEAIRDRSFWLLIVLEFLRIKCLFILAFQNDGFSLKSLNTAPVYDEGYCIRTA